MRAYLSLLVIATLAWKSSLTLAEKIDEVVKSSIVSHRFEYDNGIYELSETALNWYFARDDCTRRGMDLVSIETIEEQEAIVAEISIYGEDFWTAASDNHSPLIFYWESTGHALGPYSNWAPGQPGYGDYGCAALSHLDSYQWYIHTCLAVSKRYICEKRDKIDESYLQFSYGGVDYSISYNHMTWFGAKNDCRMKGMRLVSIETEEIYEAIRQGVKPFEQLENFWISLTDLGREGNFYWDSTGKALGPFNDWMEGEPSLGDLHCTFMANVNDTSIIEPRWKTYYCSTLYRYICESIPSSSKDNSHSKQVPNAIVADEIHTNNQELTRFKYRSSTYEISDVKVDWYLAQTDCKLKGMELMSIETQEEQDAIVSLIGGYSENIWTSGTTINDIFYRRRFTWDSTGRAVWQYANFGSSLNISSEDCIYLNYEDGFKWHPAGCRSENLRYICEKKDSFEDEEFKFSFGNNLYEASTHTRLWWDANRDCRTKGMRLISIDNENLSNFINFVLTNLDENDYTVYTSGNSHYGGYKYTWDSTGENIGPFTNWAADEPKWGAVQLRSEGGVYEWITGSAYGSHLFLCTAEA